MDKINRILLIIITCLLVLILAVLLFKRSSVVQNQIPPKGNPIDQQPLLKKDFTRSIILGEQFTAKKGQIFTVNNSYGDTFVITDFLNVTCSSGGECFLPTSKQIVYKIQTATVPGQQVGKEFNSLKESDLANMPYYVVVKRSDYKTYADVVIESQGKGN